MNLQPWSWGDRVYVEELTERVMLMWLRLFLRKVKINGDKKKRQQVKTYVQRIELNGI